jgi:hypothetical protein
MLALSRWLTNPSFMAIKSLVFSGAPSASLWFSSYIFNRSMHRGASAAGGFPVVGEERETEVI